MSQIFLYITPQHQNVLPGLAAINTLLTIEIKAKTLKMPFLWFAMIQFIQSLIWRTQRVLIFLQSLNPPSYLVLLWLRPVLSALPVNALPHFKITKRNLGISGCGSRGKLNHSGATFRTIYWPPLVAVQGSLLALLSPLPAAWLCIASLTSLVWKAPSTTPSPLSVRMLLYHRHSNNRKHCWSRKIHVSDTGSDRLRMWNLA